MGNIVNISLAEMTRERMHELYRGFSLDPIIFEELLPGVEYTYRPEKVDALFDMRKREENSIAFAILAEGAVIGELGLRKIDREEKSCELSIHMQNDSVKNKGYGTAAERLALTYVFTELKLDRVWAETLEKNRRSQHVLEKLGFRRHSTENGYHKYELQRKDWK